MKKEKYRNDKHQSGFLKSSDPVRIMIYIFPNQLEMLEKIAKKTGRRKRHMFFEMIAQYIAEWRGKV